MRDFNLVSLFRDVKFAKNAMKELLGMDKYLHLKKQSRKKRRLMVREEVSKNKDESSDVDTDPLSLDNSVADDESFNQHQFDSTVKVHDKSGVGKQDAPAANANNHPPTRDKVPAMTSAKNPDQLTVPSGAAHNKIQPFDIQGPDIEITDQYLKQLE